MTVEDRLSSFDARGERLQELKQNPMYGFKAQLVRLIGNLCFRNKINQDKVEESLLHKEFLIAHFFLNSRSEIWKECLCY